MAQKFRAAVPAVGDAAAVVVEGRVATDGAVVQKVAVPLVAIDAALAAVGLPEELPLMVQSTSVAVPLLLMPPPDAAEQRC